MSIKSLIYDDCCLLIDINLNSQRIRQLLERRFKSNSNKISFDFKSFNPEQPSNNAKVSRSFLRFQPKRCSTDDSEEYVSSESDCSDKEEDTEEASSINDDDYYNKLAEWEPKRFQPIIETDDEEEEVENTAPSITTETGEEHHQMDLSSNTTMAEDVPTTHVEDLLVTFIHRPLKSEPIAYDDDVFDNPPQLDGHVDLPSTGSPFQPNRHKPEKDLSEIIAKVNERTLAQKKTIQIHQIPPSTNKFCLNDETKKKPVNKTPRKSISSPAKVERSKGQSMRDGKLTKKPMSRILNAVMKNNEDAIREADTRLSLIHTNNQRSSRILSDSGISSSMDKYQNPRKLISQQQMKASLMTKSTSVSRNQQSSSQSKEKSAFDHMKLAQRKLNHFQVQQQQQQQSKPTTSNSSTIKSKSKENITNPPKSSKSTDLLAPRSLSTSNTSSLNDRRQQSKKKVKKVKRLSTVQSNLTFNVVLPTSDHLSSKKKPSPAMPDFEDSAVTNKQQLTSERSEPSENTTNSSNKTAKRSATFFDGCIVIDDDDDDDDENKDNIDDNDDDIQEIERQQYSIAYDIRARQKDLDHIVHSSLMHIKWLLNLEYLLLDHILICHEDNLRPLNTAYDNSVITKCESRSHSSIYQIEPSFISIIIINFIKTFLLRNSLNDQQEFSFVQFGITSHLRYLLIELPTYVHNEEKDLNDDCSKCHQYSLIINILFDLLFDLIEYDLCGMTKKVQYRSSLIEDDYFTTFLQSKVTTKNPFYRIKLIIYFIELLGIHMSKCQNRKAFQFNQNEKKLVHSMEEFIRHIIVHTNNLITERISLCFNVMELCLLFVSEKSLRIKQMSLFLAELCKDDLTYLNLFLFDENLFADIRLLLINELIWKKFNLKLVSVNHVNAFFQLIQDTLKSKEPIDNIALLLLRSLLNTYADLITEIKTVPSMYSNHTQQLTLLLQNQFKLIFRKLVEVSFDDPTYFQQMERTLIFYRLLKCKWNKL